MSDPRDTFIARTVKDATFADVGGLWGTINEKISVACMAGAIGLTMIDAAPPNDPLWDKFRVRLTSLGIPPDSIWCESRDAHDLGDAPIDVVHCSGVVYHSPEPMRLLTALRRVTRECCILTSAIVPAVVADAAIDGWLSVSTLGAETKRLLAEHWRPLVGDQAVGITAECEWNPSDYAPWWWLPTVDGLKRLAASVGFTVVDEAPFWDGNAHTLLLG